MQRIRPWLRETHGTQFELVRHFLAQQFAYELLSSDQLRRLAITVLAALGCAGPLIIRLYLPKYAYLQSLPSPDLYEAAVLADRLFFISLSMICVGLLSAFQWHNLFPNAGLFDPETASGPVTSGFGRPICGRSGHICRGGWRCESRHQRAISVPHIR